MRPPGVRYLTTVSDHFAAIDCATDRLDVGKDLSATFDCATAATTTRCIRNSARHDKIVSSMSC